MKLGGGEAARVLTGIGLRLRMLRMLPAQAKLAREGGHQKDLFFSLRKRFPEEYNKIRDSDISKFTLPLWDDFNKSVERVFLPTPPFSFLRDKVIKKTMFVTAGRKWMSEQLAFLEERLPRKQLEAVLREEYAGNPILLNAAYLTSHNSIHHLHHIMRFLSATKTDLDEIHSVVEWCGGYGNLAKIFTRLTSLPPTYVIIDTPLFSCIQWLYLATCLGEEHTNLLTTREDQLQPGKINLVPLCLVNQAYVNADLFISTWALSESSRFSQDYVVQRKWFNARHLLLAYQESGKDVPDAERVEEMAKGNGAVIEGMPFLAGNHYAFR